MDDNYIINRVIDILNSQNSNLLIGNITSPRPGTICQVSTNYGIKSAYNINCTYPGNAIVVWDKDEEQYYVFTNNPSKVISSRQLSYRKNREQPIKNDKIDIAILVRDNSNNSYVLTNNKFTNFNGSYTSGAIKLYGNIEGNWEIYTRNNTSYKTYKNNSQLFNVTNLNSLSYRGNGNWSSTPLISIPYTRVLVSNNLVDFNNNWQLRTTVYDNIFIDQKVGSEIVKTYNQRFTGAIAILERMIDAAINFTQGYVSRDISVTESNLFTYNYTTVGSNYNELLTNYILQHTITYSGSSLTYLLPTQSIINTHTYLANITQTYVGSGSSITINNVNNLYVINEIILNGSDDQYIYKQTTRNPGLNDNYIIKYYIKDYQSSEIELITDPNILSVINSTTRISWLKNKLYYVKTIDLQNTKAVIDLYELQGNSLVKTEENIEVKFKSPTSSLVVFGASYYPD